MQKVFDYERSMIEKAATTPDGSEGGTVRS
jgi:hypothetical protein